MTVPLQINKLYAWVSVDEDGDEGVCASSFPGLGVVPLIGADKERIESYRARAGDIATMTGIKVRLKVFTNGTVIDEIGPQK